ncbi:quinol dehydrogenase ferredoxin subunit NapH [Litorilituus lipolyticus]|uniref:Quinol dehydrogenase ferredoxin subunit NapH n=1 Tax=Litorilituus lipolyticus TaxID=2491017 RepID=A0A502KSG7_9GAMM|nr:quinol dehydrogenase ferredoxin subunit NapH [Litorilituus lipolyticus]TPH14578.1 quinol dehydrogenase ferredoxin subunit NapH [Litorilituus lipolyticus]
MKHPIGHEAIETKGWFATHKYLLLRRFCQLGILALFVIGPLLDIWIIKGNLSSSLLLDTVPMTDPFVALQAFAAGHLLESSAIIGAMLITGFYFLLGGRVFCSWVCPVNMISDAAQWLRRKLKIRTSTKLSRKTRFWVLAMTLVLPIYLGTMAWELINPVSMFHRGVIFGMGAGWVILVGIFLFDLLLVEQGWCGHICPQGAFYNLVGRFSPIKVTADKREQCDKCMDCFAVCPEPQVLKMPLFGENKGFGPLITSADCTNCARCIDICSKDVFKITTILPEKAEV